MITFHFQTHFFRSTIVWVGHGHGLISRDRGDPLEHNQPKDEFDMSYQSD